MTVAVVKPYTVPVDELFYESITFCEGAIKDKMNMIIHQAECQDLYVAFQPAYCNYIHPGNKCFLVVKKRFRTEPL